MMEENIRNENTETVREEPKAAEKEMLEYVDAATIQNPGRLIGKLNMRSMTTTILMIVAGLLLLIFVKIPGIKVLGAFMVITTAVVTYLVKDARAAEVYDDAVVLYSYEEKGKAVRIPLDRIVEWNNNDREDNKLNFRLDNNQVFSVVCCETSKADNYLNQVLPDNNTWDLRRDMIREKSRNADANFKKKVKGLFNGKK